VRIITGKYRGKKIIPPKNLPVRPTTDMAKESLFNILQNSIDLNGLQVLDLFAGTGSISYEFISRGASKVVAVDSNRQCVRFIQQTAEKLSCADLLKAVKSDAYQYFEQSVQKFDVVFCDPPYDNDELSDWLMKVLISKKETFKIMVVEHESNKDLSSFEGYTDHRKYGSVNFSFFKSEI
jgi:16S rRNA (guanine966-N2)-methyltransferase